MVYRLIAVPMSSQLPCVVMPYIRGRERQSPSNSTARKTEDDANTRLAHPTSIRGIPSFSKINADIVNGEKIVMKCRVQVGSNELMLAMFPVPKKHRSVYNI